MIDIDKLQKLKKIKQWYKNSDKWDWEFIHAYSFFILMLACIPMGCTLIALQGIDWIWITLIAMLLAIKNGFNLFFNHWDNLTALDKKAEKLFKILVHKVRVWFLGD